jgi:hypothetical protein
MSHNRRTLRYRRESRQGVLFKPILPHFPASSFLLFRVRGTEILSCSVPRCDSKGVAAVGMTIQHCVRATSRMERSTDGNEDGANRTL